MIRATSKITIVISLISLLFVTAFAQEQKSSAAPAVPMVTATANGNQVRFASLGEVREIRLELFDAYGQKVYDSSFTAGNLLDYRLRDQQGQHLQDGSYMFVVTVHDLSGQSRQKYGTLSLQHQQVSLEHVGRKHLPEAQAQALETNRQSGDQYPVDRVGVEVPPAESAGANSSTETNSASKAAGGGANLLVSQQATTNSTAALTAAGPTTPNRLTKWTDGSGTLGDSVVSEINGVTVFGQESLFFPSAPDYHVVEIVGTGTKTPLTLLGGSGTMEFWKDNPTTKAVSFGLAVPGTPKGDDMLFSTWTGSGWFERMRITNDGRIGLGTSNPLARLHVEGSIKIGGAGNGITFPDGSTMTTAPSGSGGTPSGNSIVNAINDQATSSTINDSRLSGNVARLSGANAWTGANVFTAGLSANGTPISNVGNPAAATDAANKGYVDSNFLKINPGAPQVSVGDANGTAAMLNLRGGSTCCSGPGGYSNGDFKVYQNGSFIATGTLGIGTIPVEGQGYRTMWYTYKGAFRSGYAVNEWDDANTGFFSWAGGSQSTASGLYSFSFGDTNFATSTSSIAFGSGNEVKGAAGFSAGAGNRVCATYGVAFGNKAQSGGPLVNGKCDPDSFNITGLAAVAIGYNVTADKDHTMALGKFASNNGFSGTFVWSDGSATASADAFKNTANNEFAARATGGFRFRTNLTGTTGCNLPAGSGVFNCTSSRLTKENFLLVNGEEVLSSLRKLPVSTWNYIAEGQQSRHMGPMAEDFYKAFRLGMSNTSIGVQDLAGVSLAAVKALELRTAELQRKASEVDQLRTQVNELRSANAAMQQRLAALEQNMKASTRQQHAPKRLRR